MPATVGMSDYDHDAGWTPTPSGGFQSRLPNNWQGARATHGVTAGSPMR